MKNVNNERYYKEVIKQYIESEIGPEEAMELLIQIQGLDAKFYDPNIYKKSKRRFVALRNIGSRFFNKTTMSAAAGVIGLNVMLCINSVLDGRVTDIVLATKAVKIMMLEETVLIALAFVLCIAHEVQILHRMGIKVLSLDFFRLNPNAEVTDELVEETSEEEEE